ncbi:MAG: hypothetical protein COA57_00085 [Flavobacteriales bacterium]|nr:MAG: hypothetical protein COA57_00085 [Flavobacteriales bacterium]
MIIKAHIKILAAIWLITLLACNEKLSSEKEMYQWFNEPENGLMKTKAVNGIKLTVKYLPVEYLAYKELNGMDGYDKTVRDSIMDTYDSSYTFLLTIGPDEESGEDFDIQRLDITNYSEYKDRVMSMNFHIGDCLILRTEHGEFKPVLSAMENVYGLSKHRNIYIVFSPSHEKSELLDVQTFDLIFNDELFETGINHFVFQKTDFEAVPKINFWKTTT